jgi:TonB family protein
MSRTTAIDCRTALVCAVAIAAWPSFAQDPVPPTEPVEQQQALAQYVESLRQARDGLINARDFNAALGPAEIVVKELEATDNSASADKIVLAYVLAELARFEEAESLYFETIDEIGEEEGEFSASLILPLRLLGRSYIGARMFPQAITVLEQAQHISQRNEGLFNVEQTGLLDDMTTAYLATGDTVTAKDLQIERLTNAQRRFGAQDRQVIPFHNRLADYYERSRLRGSAREQYEAVLTILDSSGEATDPALLEPLRNIARIDLMSSSAREALDRIDAILGASTNIDARERGLSLAVLGDARILADDPSGAREYYSQAYALLDEKDATASEYFSEPTMVWFVPPLTAVDRGTRSLPYAWGTVVIEFDVGADGRVTTVKRIGSEPRDAIERAYVERLRQAYFRPRLADGEPAITENLLLTHYFRYYVDDEEKSVEESEAAE